jgi:hypothetical protein
MLSNPLGDARCLYHALVDAVVPDTEPKGDYYTHIPQSDDGGYLERLVSLVRDALTRLPSRGAVAEVSECAAMRCAEAQIQAHAVPRLGSVQLEMSATHNQVETGLRWRELFAGAGSSGLALHALIAAAADPRTSREQALAIDEVYLSICALTTLLDGLIDYKQDIRSLGRPGYIRYYEDHDALTQGLLSVIHRARSAARDAPQGAHHLMTLVGVAAYYISAPTAGSDFAQPVTRQVRRELEPLITQTLAVMRTWRAAKRARRTIPRAHR